MASVVIILSKRNHEWFLETESGHPIGRGFRGDEEAALRWGQIFVSTWYNWIVVLKTDREQQNEEKNRMLGETF